MKVAIVAGGAKKRFFKPPEDAEVWVFNGQWAAKKWLPKIDRCFNVHNFVQLERYGYDTHHDQLYSALHPETPFYVAEEWPRKYLAGQKHFPREDMAKDMPRGNYHCGSIDWITAFAIHMGATEIYLAGVGLCLEAGEPISARACLEYWIGYAEGKGIKVELSKECDIMHFYHLVKSNLIYGYDDTPIYEDRTRRGNAPPYDYRE